MNFKKMSAKALSVFMSLLLLFSVFAPAVSAADAGHYHVTEKPDLNYVSLGDSMSNGFGLDGYNQNGYFDIFANGEIGQYGKGSYTEQFANYLSTVYNVNHSKLAVSAMLSRDLLFLVGGGKYVEDGYRGFIDYLGVHHSKVDEAFLANLQAMYIETIKNADVITIGIGNAEFGAYIMHKLMDCVGFAGGEYTDVIDYVQLEALKETCDPALVEKVIELRDKYLAMLPQLGDFTEEQVETIANLFIYTILDFCNNYTKIMDAIVALNPDVEIVVVGLMNTLNGMMFELNGESKDLGEYMGYALDVVNAHITTYTTVQVAINEAYKDATVYFAATPKVEVILDTYADGLNDVVRERFHATIVGENGVADGYVWALMGLPYLSLDDIKAFEADRIAYFEALPAQIAQQYVTFIEYYLALENAIVEASKGASLGLDSLVAISDLSIVKDIILDATVYEAADVEAAILASKTNKDETYKDFLARVEADLKAAGSTSYLTDISFYEWLVDYVYVDGDITDFYADVEELSANKLIDKIAIAIYNGYYSPVLDDLNPNKDYLARAKVIAKQLYDYATGILTVEDYYANYYETLYFVPVHMAETMCESALLKGLLNLFGRCLVGNGVGAHPSADGHSDIFVAVKEAYVNQHTVVDETVDNIVLICEFLYENYGKIYAYLYDKAVDAGVIAELNAYLDEAVKAIEYAEAWANEYDEYFRSADFAAQIGVSADNAIATIEALRDFINNADELDAESLDKLVATLSALEANLADLAALINIAAEDAVKYADEEIRPVVEAEIAKALAILNEKVNAVLETINAIEETVKEQLAAAEALVKEFIAIAEAYLAELVGKKEDAEAYLRALLNDFLNNSAFSANYHVSADSFYLAIGNDNLYAEILADKMGLGADQFATMGWNDIDSSIIAKADLITIGYSESMISGFAIDQIFGYIKNYIDVDLRDSVSDYAEEAINHFFSQMTPKPADTLVDKVLGMVNEVIDGSIDEITTNPFIAGAKLENMDWAELVGAENVHYVESALAAVKNALVEAGIPETYYYEVPVIEYALATLTASDAELAELLSHFNEEEIIALFGEYANFTAEIPVADSIVFAVESYLYSYVKFNVEYAQLVYAINAINPNAQVVLLGNYNALADLGLEIVIDDVVIDLADIFTDSLQNSANDYANAVIESIFAALNNATESDKIEAGLGDLNANLNAGADVLYGIILGVLSEVESIRDCINGTVIGIPEITLPENVEIPEEIKGILDLVNGFNWKVLADIDWSKLIGSDAADKIAGEASAIIEAVSGAIAGATAVVENALEQIGLIEDVTITLPTLDLIYANLDKFDATTRAWIDSLTEDELRAALGELSEYVVTYKVLSLEALDFINGLYDDLAAQQIVIKGTSIDLGEVIAAPISAHALVYAFSMKNVIFVDIADAETVFGEGSIEEFLLSYIFDKSVADVSEAGHAYIAEQIYNALNVVCDHNDVDGDHVCDYCGETVSDCADANNDGVCDICGACVDHRYDNACDADCNNCGATRTPSAHVYDNACDADCNVCGATRTPAAHVYDNACDTSCNVCGATRTVADHVYDNACDADCNVCGATRTPADHVYDNACDADCNVCGATRTPADHVYDNSCDTDCNVCGATRTDIEHVYDNACDADCNNCGATRTPADHVFGEWVTTKEATKKEAGERQRTCSVCGAVETEVIPQLKGLSTGAIVAIVIGSVAVVAGAGVAVYFLFIKKKPGNKNINVA